jgi:hypothetical protein
MPIYSFALFAVLMAGVGVSLKSCRPSKARRRAASINCSAARERFGRKNLSITCCARMKVWTRKSITSAITPFAQDWSHRPIGIHGCGGQVWDLQVWGRVSDPSRPEGPQIFWWRRQLPSFARLDGSKTRPHTSPPHIRRAGYWATSLSTLPPKSTTYTSPAESWPNELIVRPVESSSVRVQRLAGASVRLQIFPFRSPKM